MTWGETNIAELPNLGKVGEEEDDKSKKTAVAKFRIVTGHDYLLGSPTGSTLCLQQLAPSVLIVIKLTKCFFCPDSVSPWNVVSFQSIRMLGWHHCSAPYY